MLSNFLLDNLEFENIAHIFDNLKYKYNVTDLLKKILLNWTEEFKILMYEIAIN